MSIEKAPSEGIEPPFQEPESYVLSITPRGHHHKYTTFSLYKGDCLISTIKNQTLYLTITD